LPTIATPVSAQIVFEAAAQQSATAPRASVFNLPGGCVQRNADARPPQGNVEAAASAVAIG
jgi:hypothetical protein